MQAEGLSLQAMANRFNNDGVPTLSGKGRWQKGTIGNLLAQEEGEGDAKEISSSTVRTRLGPMDPAQPTGRGRDIQ
jgi:hypothetical protein